MGDGECPGRGREVNGNMALTFKFQQVKRLSAVIP